MKVIHAENSLDLGEESRQEPEISSGHPNEACYYFRNELPVREDNAGRRFSFFKTFRSALACKDITTINSESDMVGKTHQVASPSALSPPARLPGLLAEVRTLIGEARRQATAAVNVSLTALYWRIGRRLGQEVLAKERAGYGEQVMESVAKFHAHSEHRYRRAAPRSQ